jgi:hypothetical protein
MNVAQLERSTVRTECILLEKGRITSTTATAHAHAFCALCIVHMPYVYIRITDRYRYTHTESLLLSTYHMLTSICSSIGRHTRVAEILRK